MDGLLQEPILYLMHLFMEPQTRTVNGDPSVTHRHRYVYNVYIYYVGKFLVEGILVYQVTMFLARV